VALEDSRTGLQAAVSARTVAIGVPHIVALDGLDADAIWDSLDGRGVDDLAVEFTRPRAARRRPCERRGPAARSVRAIACS
jgi:beta-phosphoglucomutase-like phosphatase (HAD superfamily)